MRWIWAFIDRPAGVFEESARFWTEVTGTKLSERRGARDEFATLLPEEGDACLKIQAVLEGGGAHLDLEFDDVALAMARVVQLGGSVVQEDGDWAWVRSPSGYGFCVTAWHGAAQPPASHAGPDGVRTLLDHVCLDVAPEHFDAETAFWSGLTTLALVNSRRWDEFAWLNPSDGPPVVVIFQRLGESRATTAHLDMSTSDADKTRAWHESLGAEFVRAEENWLVMRDPGGGTYCLIRRAPQR